MCGCQQNNATTDARSTATAQRSPAPLSGVMMGKDGGGEWHPLRLVAAGFAGVLAAIAYYEYS